MMIYELRLPPKSVLTLMGMLLVTLLSITEAFAFDPVPTLNPVGLSGVYCRGTSFTVAYRSTDLPFTGENLLQVELSNADGSFASPLVIGCLETTCPTGEITVSLNSLLPTGTGYRFRLVANNYEGSFLGVDNGADIAIGYYCPAGIDKAPLLWLRADQGVTQSSGGQVNLWEDCFGRTNDNVQTNAIRQPSCTASATNFNPAVQFLGPQWLQDNEGIPDAVEYYGMASAIGMDGNNDFGSGNPPAVDAHGKVIGTTYIGNIDAVRTATVTTTIDEQPSNVTFYNVRSATITAKVSIGSDATVLQWQVSEDEGQNWSDITDNTTYSGMTSAVLTLKEGRSDMNGNRYRLKITPSDNVSIHSDGIYSDAVSLLTCNLTGVVTKLSDQTCIPAGDNPSDGKVYVTPSGGTMPYTFAWNTSPVRTTDTIDQLAPGSYAVTVTDANGCTWATGGVAYDQDFSSYTPGRLSDNPPGSQLPRLESDLDNWYSEVDGNSAFFIPPSLVDGLSALWFSDSPGTGIDKLFISDPITVRPNIPHRFSANVRKAGSNPPVFTAYYSEDNGATWIVIGSVDPIQDNVWQIAEYIFTPTVSNIKLRIGSTTEGGGGNDGGLSFVRLRELEEGTPAINVNAATELCCNLTGVVTKLSDQTCIPAGDNPSDGKVYVTPSGGTMPYTFAWNTSPVRTTDTIDQLEPGSYAVTVTDADGCTWATGGVAYDQDFSSYTPGRLSDNPPGSQLPRLESDPDNWYSEVDGNSAFFIPPSLVDGLSALWFSDSPGTGIDKLFISDPITVRPNIPHRFSANVRKAGSNPPVFTAYYSEDNGATWLVIGSVNPDQDNVWQIAEYIFTPTVSNIKLRIGSTTEGGGGNDGGLSFVRLRELDEGTPAINVNAATASCCNFPTEAGAIVGVQTICPNTTAEILNSDESASGQTGTLEYRWQKSTTSSTTGFTDIASTNLATYAPGVLSQTTWFRRLAGVDCFEDWSGAAVSNVIKVTVEDVTPPTINCLVTQTLVLGATCSAALPDYRSMATNVNDNCGVQSVSQLPAPGTVVSSSGPVTVTLTVLDVNGLSTSCSFTVNKVDITPPAINCSNTMIRFNGEESIPITVSDVVTASDNCGVESIVLTPSYVSCEQLGQVVPVQVVVTDVNGNASACMVEVTVRGLPCGWSHNSGSVGTCTSDIDYNPLTGHWPSSATNCRYGSPFTSDKLMFAQYQLCGDGSITAQVIGLDGAQPNAGITMRESNDPGSKKVQLMINRISNIVRREIRTSTGGQAFPMAFSSPCERTWLRIVRTGNMFRGYTSMDGITWWYVMNVHVPMNACLEIGLVLTNMQNGIQGTATFANVSVTGSGSGPALIDAGEAQSLEDPTTLDVRVYPNPTDGLLHIETSDYIGSGLTVSVYDMRGRLMLQRDGVQEETTTLDVSSLPAGVYQLRIGSARLPILSRRIVIAK